MRPMSHVQVSSGVKLGKFYWCGGGGWPRHPYFQSVNCQSCLEIIILGPFDYLCWKLQSKPFAQDGFFKTVAGDQGKCLFLAEWVKVDGTLRPWFRHPLHVATQTLPSRCSWPRVRASQLGWIRTSSQ